MNSYKKLLGNSFVFAVGNLGSKIISFILVPLYTYYLTTTEYGSVDLVTTSTSLLLPIVSANIFDAVFRFAMDKKESNTSVLSNSLFVAGFGVIIFVLLYPLISLINVEFKMLNYIYIILILQIFQSVFSQFIRAIGAVKIFALNGIIMTLVTGALNVILLTQFIMGIDGYLISIILANIVSIIYLCLSVKIWSYVSLSTVNKQLVKKMLSYSIPMIPNSIMWWLISASNRYFILYFVGASANGIYAAANKIPSILSILSSIFTQAWQLSAIEEYENNNKSEFYSAVFNYYSSLLFIGTSAIIVVLKYFMGYFVSPEYYDGWKVVPFLLLSVIFSSFSSFLGTNYLAVKQTAGVFRTSIYGGTASVVFNILLVPSFGILGAAVASMLSFLIMWVLRIIDTKKYIELSIDLRNLLLNLVLITMQITVLFLDLSWSIEAVLESTILAIVLLNNKKLLLSLSLGIKKIMYK